MRSLIALGLLALAWPGTAPAAQDAPPTAEDGFYAEGHGRDGRAVRSTDHHVPYEPGDSCYGWRLEFGPSPRFRSIHERLVLPGRATQWNSAAETQVTPDGKVGETDVPVDPVTGVAENSWCVAAGDPRGVYYFELYDGFRLVRRLRFTVGVDET